MAQLLKKITFMFLSVGSTRADSPVSIFMRNFVHNALNFNKYLFTHPDTYRILAATAPFYGMARIADCPTHAYFYDAHNHRNVHQLVPVFNKSVDVLMGVSLTTLIMLGFFAREEHTKKTGEVFIAALPFLWIYKDIIKTIPFPGNIRPKKECFDPNRRHFGGFPSGHMFEATFMLYLFAQELGVDYGIPLGAFALLVGIHSVTSNRHYLSQVVAGAVFGCIFGAAAHHVMRYNLPTQPSYGIMMTDRGITVSLEKQF